MYELAAEFGFTCHIRARGWDALLDVLDWFPVTCANRLVVKEGDARQEVGISALSPAELDAATRDDTDLLVGLSGVWRRSGISLMRARRPG
ncbi:MAG: hypothetical protein A2146_01700 [Actinobacteria bacterium RBG_16_67_10]|nr:MAG: hypothetical protein A2146_01700 [Actinobacteria bacterium RBG_16_67_10]